MVATPKVIAPDGVARELTLFSTTMISRFFKGTMAVDTVDMQISIRGGAFTSDPDLILFEGTTFSFPNPATFPDGLELASGTNIIEVRSISFSGAVSASARVEATLVQESSLGLIGTIPTNVSAEQLDDEVKIRVEGVPDGTFRGINFYASRFQGGGATGYQRVSLNTISNFEVVQETSNIGAIQVDSPVATNPDGTVAADPLYVKITELQTSSSDVIENLEDIPLTPENAAAVTEMEQANLLRTDFVQVFEVPETTTVIRSNYSVESLVSRVFYTFKHNRQFGTTSTPATVPIGEFAATPLTEPLFYVTTAVFFDPELQLEIESAFSAEISGQPTIILENVGTFPAPSRLDIVQDTIEAISRTTPQIAIQPGAVIRDTVVDPISSEVVRLRFLVDYLYRIQSYDTLLQIDGINADGSSLAVARSPYKQALQRVFDLQSPQEVQVLIDTSFNQLASRNGVFRNAGVRARGFARFFTRTRPTATLFIPLGSRVASGGVQFVTTTDGALPISNIAAFFDPTTNTYRIDLPIEAESPGTTGNLGAGQIRSIVSSLPGLSVTNPNQTFGGTNQENNLQLSTRARNALAAVDTGTEQGILQVAADVAGVQAVSVVSASDPLMQRDYDTDYDKHVGGKVDVWVRGESLGTVTDSFAFTYETAFDVQFQVIGNPLALQFRALDDTLSVENPIAEMLDNLALGSGLRNATRGVFYDLTDVTILDYRTIQLSNSGAQPNTTFGDIILGDYRYVTSTRFVFPRQPVDSVISVVGTVSGTLPQENWEFVRPDDPLLLGRSTEAQAYLNIIQVDGIPSGAFTTVTGEVHTLLGEFNEFVNNLGVNSLTVQVFNDTGTILYRGPSDPSGISDYTIVPGTQTTALALRRTVNSAITSGQTVLLRYEHAENFTVQYQTNFVILSTQQVLNAQKNLTADVLAKAAVQVAIDITATVVTQSGFRPSAVDTNVRTNLTTFLRSLSSGASIRQSDIISVLDRTVGVSYVENPLRKLTRGVGSLVVRESVPATDGEVVLILGTPSDPYSTDTVKTWLLENPLDNPTVQGGGDGTQFAGVFQDDRPLTLQLTDPEKLKEGPDRAFIIGNRGLIIPDFSDSRTIQANFPAANTAAEIQVIREGLTANKVLVSLAANDRPQVHEYTVTYTVTFVETRIQDIEGSSLEVFEVGNLLFTFAEDSRSGR